MARSENGRLTQMATGLAVGGLAGILVLDLELPAMLSFWRDSTFLVPAGALVGALVSLTPLRRLLVATAAALSLLWLAASYTPLVPWLTQGLVRRDAPREADAVFVFGSRLQADGEPTSEAMSRLLEAVDLVAQRRTRVLVVSELMPPSRLYAPIARAWTERLAPGCQVLAVGPVRNTHDEAVAVARLFREKGWRRVLAVSSPLHTRRAAASLEREGLEVVSVPAIETRYDVETLDRPGERRAAFSGSLHERLGLLVYRRRGWI